MKTRRLQARRAFAGAARGEVSTVAFVDDQHARICKWLREFLQAHGYEHDLQHLETWRAPLPPIQCIGVCRQGATTHVLVNHWRIGGKRLAALAAVRRRRTRCRRTQASACVGFHVGAARVGCHARHVGDGPTPSDGASETDAPGPMSPISRIVPQATSRRPYDTCPVQAQCSNGAANAHPLDSRGVRRRIDRAERRGHRAV